MSITTNVYASLSIFPEYRMLYLRHLEN